MSVWCIGNMEKGKSREMIDVIIGDM
jgi:hypothetical protein